MTVSIRFWKNLKRHPLSLEYKDLEGWEWEDFLESVKQNGILNQRKITLYEGMVLDGWQLQRACVILDIKPEYQGIPKKMNPSAFVGFCNDARRHETEEIRKQRREKRRARVVKGREEGKSTRTIADEAGVGESTVRRDLNASPAPGGAGDEPVKEINGRDGKTYHVKNERNGDGEHEEIIFCSSCERRRRLGTEMPKNCPDCKELRETRPEHKNAPAPPKREGGHRPMANGAARYGQAGIEDFKSVFGRLVRHIDQLGRSFNAKESKTANDLRDELEAFYSHYLNWYKTLIKDSAGVNS